MVHWIRYISLDVKIGHCNWLDWFKLGFIGLDSDSVNLVELTLPINF